MKHKPLSYFAKGKVDAKTGMNSLESKYSTHLEVLRVAGGIHGWRFGSVKFRMADKTWYLPDFQVMMNDGTIEFHETKGFMTDKANVKIKTCAALYSEYIFRLVKEEKTTPEIKRKASEMNVKIGTLKGWEITVYPPHKDSDWIDEMIAEGRDDT